MRPTSAPGRAAASAAGRRGPSMVWALAMFAVLVGGCTPDAATDLRSPSTSASVTAPRPTSTPGSASTGDVGGDLDASSGENGTASEILPEQPPGPTSLGDAPQGPELTGPLPESGSAQGTLVEGFPSDVVPVIDGLEIVASSVSAMGDRLQLGLEASTDAEADAVTDEYVTALTARGFRPGPAPSVPGSTATAFLRGEDGLVLTVRSRTGGGTELSIAGTLVAAS